MVRTGADHSVPVCFFQELHMPKRRTAMGLRVCYSVAAVLKTAAWGEVRLGAGRPAKVKVRKTSPHAPEARSDALGRADLRPLAIHEGLLRLRPAGDVAAADPVQPDRPDMVSPALLGKALHTRERKTGDPVSIRSPAPIVRRDRAACAGVQTMCLRKWGEGISSLKLWPRTIPNGHPRVSPEGDKRCGQSGPAERLWLTASAPISIRGTELTGLSLGP